MVSMPLIKLKPRRFNMSRDYKEIFRELLDELQNNYEAMSLEDIDELVERFFDKETDLLDDAINNKTEEV